jgi:flagellin
VQGIGLGAHGWADSQPSWKKTMSFRVNTNVNAMSAYRNLSNTGMDLSRSITRLSTGLRINSAADDPAGLIASENFRAQISGAMDELSRLLRDARGLAVANGNSTVDANQKQANQTQLNNILGSITRISQTTSFGSKKLLNGSSGATATVNDVTNLETAYLTGTFGGLPVASNGVLNVQVTASAEQAVVTGTATYATGATTVGAGTFSINGTQFTTTAQTTRDQLIAMINDRESETGVYATVNGTNNIVLTSSQYGTNASVNLATSANGLILTTAGVSTDAGANAAATVTYAYGTNTVTSAFTSGQGLSLKDSDGNIIRLTAGGNRVATFNNAVQVMAGASSFQIGANADQTARLNLGNFTAGALGIATLDITGSDMTAALNAIDAAVQIVSTARANVGSFMRNTVESNIRSLSITKESLVATESSIRDIDVAEEMTTFTKLQILQQSGLSVLAQANSAPQSVLALLRG